MIKSIFNEIQKEATALSERIVSAGGDKFINNLPDYHKTDFAKSYYLIKENIANINLIINKIHGCNK